MNREIKYIVVHCSATPPDLDIGAQEIRGWHMSGNGWTDIGYHYVVRRNGALEKGRHIDKVGAHVKGYNSNSIGICLVGGVDDIASPDNNFTVDQFQTLAKKIRELKEKFPSAIIQGHRDFPNVKKACPSFDVKTWWANINNEKEAIMPTKAGYKTTEFWVTMITALTTTLNQSGLLGSVVLPIEAIASIAAIVAGYALSRGLAKKQ